VGGVDRVALSVIQRNIRRWLAMRNWQWWKLYTRVKPLLTQAKAEDEMRKMAEDYEATKAELAKISKQKKELEEQNVVLLQQKNDMFMQMQAEQVCWLFGAQRRFQHRLGAGQSPTLARQAAPLAACVQRHPCTTNYYCLTVC